MDGILAQKRRSLRPKADYLTRVLRDCGASLESLPYLFSGDLWRTLEWFFLPECSQGEAQLGEKDWAAHPGPQ